MVNAILNLTPQPAAVEGPSDAGKQAASADSTFTDVLNAAVAGEQAESGKEAAQETTKVDPKADQKAKSMGETVTTTEIAGAMQVAMVIPVQADVTVAVEADPQAVDNAVVAEVSAEAVPTQSMQSMITQASEAPQVSQPPQASQVQESSATDSVIPSVSMPEANASETANGESLAQSVASAKTNSQAEVIAVAPTVSKETVTTTTEAATKATSESTMLEKATVQASMPSAVQEPVTVSANPNSTEPRANLTENNPVSTQPVVTIEPETTPAKQDQRPGVQTEKPEKSHPAAAARQINPVAVSKQANVPVDSVPVLWKFDGATMQGPRILTTPAAAQMLVDSIGESSAKPAGGESGSLSGQGSTDPQAAASMGVQFTAQLREAAQQTTQVTSNSDLHVRVIDQVVREVRLSQIHGQNNLVVKLNPPDLGALRLQISQDATGMTTSIQASNSRVQGLLEAHMPLLMDSLSKAGVQMDSVSVSVGTSFNAFAQNAQHGNSQPNSSHARQPFTPGRQMGGILTASEFAPAWGRSEQTGYSWLA